LSVQRRRVDPHCWALISDTHIAADRTLLAHDINMTDQLRFVVQDVLAQPQLPTGALINGDLAFNTGETADYAAFAELIEPLRGAQIPLHLGLGNHDNRERFWAAMAADKSVVRPLVDRQVAIVRSPRANWFVLDSLDKTMSTPGVLGTPQLQWLAEALDAHADRPALVVIHHNPSPSGTKTALVETSELFEIIRPRKHVKAYFFGHTHCWSVTREDSGLYLINLPTTAYLFLFDKTQPVGWVNAQLEPKGVRLHLRCLDRGHAAHGTVSELVWRS
jgi:hypothetical protein